jgi:thiosulfate/3-mercaptopyruvate sulfurtransferase
MHMLLAFALAHAESWDDDPASAPGEYSDHAGIMVSADTAEQLLKKGARVLDARGGFAYSVEGHIPGAVRVDWRQSATGGLLSGKFGDPAKAAAYYADAGVDSTRPVIVVGAWDKGWGEEGRVAWDLLYLGHPDVHVLHGGMQRWDGPREHMPGVGAMGHLVAAPLQQYRAQMDTVVLASGGTVAAESPEAEPAPSAERAATILLDVREPDEFAGARHFGEKVGGHIPGAVNRPWRGFLGVDDDLDASQRAPVSPDLEQPIIVYCTGGVRAALVAMLLLDQGYEQVRNYDGSWWEWSSRGGAVQK